MSPAPGRPRGGPGFCRFRLDRAGRHPGTGRSRQAAPLGRSTPARQWAPRRRPAFS